MYNSYTYIGILKIEERGENPKLNFGSSWYLRTIGPFPIQV
jgi:hypothetical protein